MTISSLHKYIMLWKQLTILSRTNKPILNIIYSIRNEMNNNNIVSNFIVWIIDEIKEFI